MRGLLRYFFFLVIVRPLVLVILGLNVRHVERLPQTGPCIVIANHNSHLDTLVLMTLFPMRLLSRIHPVAAMDYFLKNRLLAWFSINIMGIIPVRRGGVTRHEDPLAGCSMALHKGDILILFPEGSRGDPERLEHFKTGIAHLAKRHPNVQITPVFLYGLGKALPKGEAILVPFFCDVFIGPGVHWTGNRHTYMNELETSMNALAREGHFPAWE